MAEYAILCPSCGGSMNDHNRVSTTMLDAFEHQPGGKGYQYIYRCPECGNTITWTYETKPAKVSIS